MASEIIKLQCDCKVKDIEELCDIIGKEIIAEFLHKKVVEMGTGTVILLAFEKLYFRVESYVSLTIMLTEDRLVQTADIIGSGGGGGLFNFDWGANASFANSAAEILKQYGFCLIE